jgi:NifU-like protein involved in Fe-S cluster formation
MIDDLYSARILSLAANLPHSGRLATPQGSAERVAKLCGSKAVVDVTLDDDGRIKDFAQTVKACALGQAAAGVVGESILGASATEILEARDAMLAMLKSGGRASRLDHGGAGGRAGRRQSGVGQTPQRYANSSRRRGLKASSG